MWSVFKIVLFLTLITCICCGTPDTESHGGRNKRSIGSMGITFPKTKWCGPGRTARFYDDLGIDADTDACCRDHDNCQPRGVYPGQLQQYCNVEGSRFQISACECDEQFSQCLSTIPLSLTSRMVAKIYRLFVTQCINYNPYTRKCNIVDRVF